MEKIDMVFDLVQKLDGKMEDMQKDVNVMKVDIGKLKTKSGIWGAIAGMIPVSMAGIWIYIKGWK